MSRPSSVGIRLFFSRVTYPRAKIVVIVGANVDGRPIPSSSSALTRLASVKRAGGWVKCCLFSKFLSLSASPSVSGGSVVSFCFSASVPSIYTFIKPSNFTFDPLARNVCPAASMSAVVD